jgi:predicted nucleic acid-binding protein
MNRLTQPLKVYWDACVWIALIGKEPGRVERCESIIALAKTGDLQIWTSSLTLVEVHPAPHKWSPGKEKAFEDFLLQDFVYEVQLDHDVAVDARELLVQNPKLRRAPDAIHLASARQNNCDELHTFDSNNLLPLNGQIVRADGKSLLIREPPPPTVGKQDDMFAPQLTDQTEGKPRDTQLDS